ncbi:MAG: tetratricopeptide repeat protein [Deltaproteobacteria bacterium]|jgi:tetratricopeptide (TPR) repeat protein|nr:tetratricopeptide repeat protein [Deltaproteobacteria bacterium]
MDAPIFNVPASVTQNIARAKAFLHKGEPLRAVEAMMDALNLFEPKKIVGKAKYETEILLMECVDELSHSPKVAEFLKSISKSKDPRIAYAPGQEEQLSMVLPLIHKALKEDEELQEHALSGNSDERKSTLWMKGTSMLKEGNAARGKALLRRLAEDFGNEPGVYIMVGEALFQANLGMDAADFLEKAIEADPGDSKAYGYLANVYTEMREFAKAERIYKLVLKRFGKNYKTLINFGNLYRAWNKRDDAYDIAKMALQEAPGNPEAEELMKWADRG